MLLRVYNLDFSAYAYTDIEADLITYIQDAMLKGLDVGLHMEGWGVVVVLSQSGTHAPCTGCGSILAGGHACPGLAPGTDNDDDTYGRFRISFVPEPLGRLVLMKHRLVLMKHLRDEYKYTLVAAKAATDSELHEIPQDFFSKENVEDARRKFYATRAVKTVIVQRVS